MPTTQTSTINATQIDRPTCARCGCRMWLRKVSQDGVGKEFRTFECPVCEVATDKQRIAPNN